MEFLQYPGPRERQLQRAHQDPLFIQFPPATTQQLLLARQDDEADLQDFIRQFQQQIEEAVKLKPQADADDVLALKSSLEILYSQACGVQGDNSKFKAALKKLLSLITNSLITAAHNDAEAMQKIHQDIEAMELHLHISESLLAADILNPNNIIPSDQLASSLLGSSAPDLAKALLLFAPEQLQDLIVQSQKIISSSEYATQMESEPYLRLQQMQDWARHILEQNAPI